MSSTVLGYARIGVIVVTMAFGSVCLVGGVLSGLTPLDAPFMSVLPGKAPGVSIVGAVCYAVGAGVLVVGGGEYRTRTRR